MINYDEIEEGKSIITGVSLEGREVTGICINNMKGLRIVNIKYGEDRLDKDFVHYDDVKTIENNI